MIYFLDGDKLEARKEDRLNEVDFRPCLGILDGGDLDREKEYLQLPLRFISEIFRGKSNKLESHEGFDYISLCIPDFQDLAGEGHRIAVYCRSDLLLFLYEDPQGRALLTGLAEALKEKKVKSLSLDRVLYEFFDRLTKEDSGRMEAMEQEIFELEESLMLAPDKSCISDIIDLRRRLLVLKRYYEQLLDIAEAIEENENDLHSRSIIRAFHMLTGRTDRLFDSVVNLRDYVSQVREAYQAQVDIGQNEIMRLFTVITAIFLPLTLIAGWYGMNLKMPEFQWAYSYPVVILASAGVAVGSCLYFKKKGWF